MELKSVDNKNKDLSKKIDYQNRLNKNILFYIRDFDLFKSEIAINKLIKDSLALIGIKDDQFYIEMQDPELEIMVDVELFSDAFNQILKNAIDEIGCDYSKLKLKVYSLPSNSPFINNNWVVFEVEDKGKGISEDFIPYVTNPFFTTKKYKALCGFGLSNTKKIIEGHDGFLEIKSGNGTIVKITIPQN